MSCINCGWLKPVEKDTSFAAMAKPTMHFVQLDKDLVAKIKDHQITREDINYILRLFFDGQLRRIEE